MPSDRVLAFVEAGTRLPSRHAMDRHGPTIFVAEDDATLKQLERGGIGPCHLASALVPCARDLYDSAARAHAADLLRQLPLALGAGQWRYAGVSLWDAVAPDFHWRCLDNLFHATDSARQLLDGTDPGTIVVSGMNSSLARALVAMAGTRGVSVSVLGSQPSTSGMAVRARAVPYLGLFRDGIRAAFLRRNAGTVSRSPFVLLNHARRNFEVVRPVLRELQCKLSPERILVAQTGSDGEREIRASGMACKQFGGYVSVAEGLEALASVAGPIRYLTSGLWKTPMARAGIRCEGVPLEALAEAEISFELPRLLGNTVREIACARRMLIEEKPVLVMVTEDRSSFSRAVCLSARAAGIPSLMVQWGPIAPNSAWLARVAADTVAVEGEAAAGVVRMCENGKDVRIVVTGQPKYDLLKEQAAAASREDLCRRFALDQTRPIVLYAAHPIWERSAQMRRNYVEEGKLTEEVTAVVRAVEAMPGVQLVVKPHPNEGSGFHQECLGQCGHPDIRLVSKEESVYPLLFTCDAVVTHRSSVGLEGLLLGKQLVIVNFSGRPDPFSYVRDGVAMGAYAPAEVGPAIRSVLFDDETKARTAERRPAFLRRHAFQGEGSSTERMVDLMLTLSRNR